MEFSSHPRVGLGVRQTLAVFLFSATKRDFFHYIFPHIKSADFHVDMSFDHERYEEAWAGHQPRLRLHMDLPKLRTTAERLQTSGFLWHQGSEISSEEFETECHPRICWWNSGRWSVAYGYFR